MTSAFAAGPTYTDPDKAEKTDKDFTIQGEYTGKIKDDDGNEVNVGVQVIALGGGKFKAVGYPGGLPGDGWNKQEKVEADGELKDGQINEYILNPGQFGLELYDRRAITVTLLFITIALGITIVSLRLVAIAM